MRAILLLPFIGIGFLILYAACIYWIGMSGVYLLHLIQHGQWPDVSTPWFWGYIASTVALVAAGSQVDDSLPQL